MSCLSLSQLIVVPPAGVWLDRSGKWPPLAAIQLRRPTGSLVEAMVPNPRCTYEIGVFSQGCQGQLRFFIRNEPAALANDFADAVKKEGRTLHHTATQDDHV